MKCSNYSWNDLVEGDRNRVDYEIGDVLWNPKGGEPHIITHYEAVKYWGSQYTINEWRCECGGLDIDHHVFMLKKGGGDAKMSESPSEAPS